MSDWHPIYAGIRAAFLADGAATTIASLAPATQWHADQLPDRKALPALRYTILAEPPHQRLASGDNITAEVQIDAYGERQDEAAVKALADAVVRLLDRVSITATGYSSVRSMCIDKPRPFKEKPYFRLRTRFRMFGTAA